MALVTKVRSKRACGHSPTIALQCRRGYSPCRIAARGGGEFMQVMSTEVVIVGGGAAGCYAAINLHKKGIGTLVVCKGLVGKSGASIFAGNLVVSGKLLGNTDEQARNTAEFLIKYHNQFLIDQCWARRCGEWIEQVYYPELEEAGLYFRRDDAGEIVTSPGKIRSVAANVQRSEEHTSELQSQ